MIDRVEIKREARDLLRQAKVSPLLMGVLMLAVSLLLDKVAALVEYGTLFPTWRLIEYLNYLAAADPMAMLDMTGDELLAMAGLVSSTTVHSLFFSILISLFMTVLYGGFYLYCMGIRQGREMPVSTLVDGLSVAGKLIWCGILTYVKTFLWSLLFFFPGIIAAYRYRFATYNLLADPSLSASEAIRLSCQQTRGMKWDLFVLDLSFIGWSLLSTLTMGLLDIWLLPYIVVCDLAYFEEGQRRLGRSPYGQGGDAPWEL